MSPRSSRGKLVIPLQFKLKTGTVDCVALKTYIYREELVYVVVLSASVVQKW